MWRKKSSIPRGQVIKKSRDTVQQKWKRAGWASQIHNQYLQSQAVVFPWSHFQFNVYYHKTPKKFKATPNAVDVAMDLLLSSQARKRRRISLSPI